MRPLGFRFGFVAVVAVASVLMLANGTQAQNGAGAAAQKPAQQSSTPSAQSVGTPRLANGKPDLSGMWGGRGGGGGEGGDAEESGVPTPESGVVQAVIGARRCAPNESPCDTQTNQPIDGEFTDRLMKNQPLYKPEFWDKVQDLDFNTNYKDPIMHCQSLGVPRIGPPVKIMQTANEVVFFYPEEFRIIPTDGRPHDPVKAQDVSFNGDSVGKYDGDTLVIDSVGFNDVTWLARGGYFHSDLMHVIEKVRRDGNTLTYEVTVDDPTVLLRPWVMDPRVIKANPNPKATIREADPCRDYDAGNEASRIRH